MENEEAEDDEEYDYDVCPQCNGTKMFNYGPITLTCDRCGGSGIE